MRRGNAFATRKRAAVFRILSIGGNARVAGQGNTEVAVFSSALLVWTSYLHAIHEELKLVVDTWVLRPSKSRGNNVWT
jgi:hypothetical protein